MIRALVLLLLIVLIGCTDGTRETIKNDKILIGPAINLKDVLRIEDASFLNGENRSSLVLPSKIEKWGDRFIYQTSDTYMINTYLIMFDSAWNYMGRIEPVSGAPGFVREVTDFFIYHDLLYVYDFQSQKFLLFDKNLYLVEERRTPYYYRNFVVHNDKLIAYSGKVVQFSEGNELAFDLMELDTALAPARFWRPFSKDKYDGLVFHTPRPLLSNGNGIFYSEWWSDTLFNVNTRSDTVLPWRIFEYQGRGIPREVYDMTHQELYQHITLEEYTAYLKGASPAIISDRQMIFSYGNRDRLGFGVYDLEEAKSLVFEDYEYSLDERLLTPKYYYGDSFFSVLYPYELMDYLETDLISRDSFESEFFNQLEKEPDDGRPVLLKFRIVLSNQ